MDEIINLNTADVTQLTRLTGIGPNLAAKIIEYRTTVHPFEEVIELAAVPGISERMVRQFEADVTVGTEVASETWAPMEVTESTVDEHEEVESGVTAVDEEIETASALVEAVGFRQPSSETEADAELSAESDVEAETAELHTTIVEPESELVEEAEPLIPTVEDIIEEQTMSNDPAEPPTQPVQNQAVDAISQRRGCIFILIGALTGAILGSVLTLALISALNNGSLQFARADRQLQNQLEAAESEVNNLLSTVEAVQSDVGTVSSQTEDVAAGQSVLSTALDEAELSLSGVESTVESAQEEIDLLAETAVELEERLDTVAESAETFDAFLDGMRALLNELPGGEPTATATPTVTPTPSEPTRTPFSVDTVTPRPTRTPRPTSTPITLPSPTPEQLP